MRKTALFVFNGDPMCFIHVLLNALDMHGRGEEARIVVEGSATRLLPELEQSGHPLNALWEKAKSNGLVAGACKACCGKMQTAESARHYPCLDDMSGASLRWPLPPAGFEIVTL